MIKQTNSLDSVVSKGYVERHFNVFYIEAILSNDPNLIFLYSEKYIIPVSVIRKYFFKYAHLCSEPGIIKDGDETLSCFLNDVCTYIRDVLKLQWIDQNSAASFFFGYPENSIHIPFGSHVINLTQEEDVLWKNIHSKHRNVIRKAEKDGVIVECGRNDKLINDYHLIDVETWSRSKRNANSKDRLINIIKNLGDHAIVYMAYLNDEPQSGAILFFNEQMCYYMHGANKNNPHIGSGNLLQWKAILDMKKIGVKSYSFVGCRINEDENSKYHGIQRFKERFGGELVQCYLFKCIFSPLYYKIFIFLSSVLTILRTGRFALRKDIIDQEMHKW